MLLAAGRGQRLSPLTDDRPKCLLEVGGRSIVSRALAALSAHGLHDVIVVDGYQSQVLRTALATEHPDLRIRFLHNPQYAATNNAYSLWLARTAIEGPMLLLDSDIVFDPQVLHRLLEDAHPNRLALRGGGVLGDEEMKVRLDRRGLVCELGKAIPPESAAGESLGIELFEEALTRRLFAALERRIVQRGRTDEFYEAAFLELIQQGAEIFPVEVGDLPCLEIDTPEDLARAQQLFVTPE